MLRKKRLFSDLHFRDLLETKIGMPIDSLPSELVGLLFKELRRAPSISFAALCAVLAQHNRKLDHSATQCISKRLLFSCISSAALLTKIVLLADQATDAVLSCISLSNSAATLRSASFHFALFTDKSAECWCRFPALESVELLAEYVTMKTFDEVLALPRASKLHLVKEGFADRLTEAALSRKSNLQDLRIYDSTDCIERMEKAMQLLTSSPSSNCNTLEKVQLTFFREVSSFDHPYLLDFVRICPNLRQIPSSGVISFDEFKEHEANLHNLTELYVDFLTVPVTQEILDLISTAAPNLRTLFVIADMDDYVSGEESEEGDIDYDGEPAEQEQQPPRAPAKLSLKVFSSLRSFDAGNRVRWLWWEFPLSLRNLNLQDFSGSDLESLLGDKYWSTSSQPPSLPRLRNLSISGTVLFDQEQLRRLLLAFPALTRLTVSCDRGGGGGDGDPPAVVSHPNLTVLSDIVVAGCSGVRPGKMPRLLSVSTPEMNKYLFDSPFESLRSVHFPVHSMNMWAKRAQTAERAFPAGAILRGPLLLKMIPSHREISILRLTSLDEVDFSREVFSALLDALPFLLNLSIQASVLRLKELDVSWFSHPILQQLSFDVADIAPQNCHDPTPIRMKISHSTLPSLIGFSLATCSGVELNFEDLANLERIGLFSSCANDPLSQLRTRLVVRRCESLLGLMSNRILFDGLELRELPSLVSCVLFCSVGVDAKVDISIPALHDFRLNVPGDVATEVADRTYKIGALFPVVENANL